MGAAPYVRKTRTKTAEGRTSSHTAFLHCLRWLWDKHAAAGGNAQPEHVKSALADADCCNCGANAKCAEAKLDIRNVHLCLCLPCFNVFKVASI